MTATFSDPVLHERTGSAFGGGETSPGPSTGAEGRRNVIAESGLPAIVVGLLSFNRAGEVIRTLRLLLRSDYPEEKLRLLVVDNASSDGTSARVRAAFGDRVEVVRLEENIGAIARNHAILGRSEEYIFQFDEDTAPADPGTLRRAIAWLEAHPGVGALCFRSLNIHSGLPDWGPMETMAARRIGDDACEGLFTVGNAMAFRRDAVQRSMGYDPRIFWGAEELQFALELLYASVVTAYVPSLAVVHRQPPRAMPRAQVVEMEVRNNVRAFMTYMPVGLGALMTVIHCCKRLTQAVKHRNRDHAVATWRGLRRGLRELPEVLATRRPTPMSRYGRHNRWLFKTMVGLRGPASEPGDDAILEKARRDLAGL